MTLLGRDNVAQVYLGLVDGGPTSDWLRRRIDWMVDRAKGPRVLDVGCDEGILPLLLARRGIEVTGIDSDADALEFARELLAREPEEVRSRVQLVHGDFLQAGQVAGLFDTVVMGELLQYVDDPGAVLDRCLESLGPGGRVVLTAPFGAIPDEGVRRTFFLTDMIDLLRHRVAREHLAVEDSHIRFVGRLSEDIGASWQGLDSEAVLSLTEAALAVSQVRMREMLGRSGGRYERLQRRFQQWVETDGAETKSQRRKAASDNARVKAIEFRSKVDVEELARIKEEFRAVTRELDSRTRQLSATRASTSFQVGSALVRGVKNPLKVWKLPFWLLRLLRSKVRPPAKTAAPSGSASPPPLVSEEPPPAVQAPHPDLARFISFPMPPAAATRTGRPAVAAILDTFSEFAFRYEVDLLLMSPEHWRDQVERARPVCLFVESAWRGNNGGWRDRIVGYDRSEDNPLSGLLEYCRSTGIPTVFWSKEDPPHFENFLGAAREFDYVFTSDADCVPRYREALGHDRIHVMPFAAQPRIHNPSREKGWPRYPVCFAGSWVSRRYPDRAEALRALLDGAMPHGLHIFDRNLTRPEFGADYRFPDEYVEAIRGTLTYDEMLTAYRCYDVMLNVNTITESPTMFARRVFESLACGTPVVSQDSVGMRKMLGEHVRVTRSVEETAGHIRVLLGDEEARVREGHLAYRHVHQNHTYRHRMSEVFERVGLEPLDTRKPPVSVLMPTMRPENVARCLENFAKQTYQNKELVLILNNAEFDLDAIRRDVASLSNVQVLHVDGRTTLGDCLNRGVEASSGQFIAKMDDDDLYGERYLSDSVMAASFSGAQVVGKGVYFVYFEATDTTALRENTPEHTFTSAKVAGGSLLILAEVVRDIMFPSLSRSEDTRFLISAEQAGCRVYSADRFNYLRVRMPQLSRHSWKISDTGFREKCRDHTPGFDLERSMI